MSNNFQEALSIIRKTAKEEVDKGRAFAELCKIFFENDDIQKRQFSKVWFYNNWAKENTNFSKTDIGIDLVAKIVGETGFCAIQCKCYESDHTISKDDIDSFISASSNKIFSRLILIDTSLSDLGLNTQKVIENLDKGYQRIQTEEFEKSRIDWLSYLNKKQLVLKNKKDLKDHQIQAVQAAQIHFKNNDRGKLIMACGTGKTLTSLKIAEKIAGKGKIILYMVPSLALMSQSIREWACESSISFNAFSACSDTRVGKRKSEDDSIEISLSDLAFPATTDSELLAIKIKEITKENDDMTVVFSTYQSIDVISEAQNKYKLKEFDLIICDEAHRTTGATLIDGDGESKFTRIHDNDYIKGGKRLYMTATPKIYGTKAKKKAEESGLVTISMDDENLYGKMFFFRGFNWAVDNNLLTDYKVVVLKVDESSISQNLQSTFAQGSELKLNDASKIIGCYKALAKIGFGGNEFSKDKKIRPIKSALAFSQNIEISKLFAKEFNRVIEDYTANEKVDDKNKINLEVEVNHIDGTFNAQQRNEKLSWLKEETGKNICRILTNVKCLSEGVDVPTLDSIIFLHPRKSQIDVIQSVGRVMRKSEDKEIGYVILPITIAPGVTAEKALNDSDRYSVVWQVLNALRSHDERLDSTINRIKLGEDVSDKIEIIDINEADLEASTAVVKDLKSKSKHETKKEDIEIGINKDVSSVINDQNRQLPLEYDFSQAIKAKIVEKCGTRDYWETWANDISKIAKAHIVRINSIVLKSKSAERKVFLSFLDEIRDDLNQDITEQDAIEMLAQHIITKPVFDTLFQSSPFTRENIVSKSIEKIVNKIYEKGIEAESDSLLQFYESVKRRSRDIVTSAGRNALINELYERFFRKAFPLTTAKLGIVYTPVEIVDFILHSVEDILQSEFKKNLTDKNIHILDPFTGTGTFIARLLQSELIKKKDLKYKYQNEIHANEIVLLAYYIAGINIESIYQDIVKENQYSPFNGIVLTDTFQMYEQERDMVANLLPDNSNKRKNQKKRKITVIVGNPPYSAGQKKSNDNAENVKYLNLDNKIKDTYAKYSKATLKNSLYDSYIRAFRWASDRINEEGIISFVTPLSWVDGFATDGMRKVLTDEFSKIFIFNLRGNKRTSGEQWQKEKANVFGQGSRSPIAITVLVKNRLSKKKAEIYYYDIGDYLSEKDKLNIIKSFKSINGIQKENKFLKINPDINNDWINKGSADYKNYITTASKSETSIFNKSGPGISTSRDFWVYNSSSIKLKKNVSLIVKNYNELLNNNTPNEKAFSVTSNKVNWSDGLKNSYKNKKKLKQHGEIIVSDYRPFFKQFLYFSSELIERKGITNLFLRSPKDRMIGVSGVGAKPEFSALMLNHLGCMDMLEKTQCLPLKIYDEEMSVQKDSLFANTEQAKLNNYQEGISDNILKLFKEKYSSSKFVRINKEQIFYYIYGVLHSKEYKEKFQNDLTKELPRIPIVKNTIDFLNFEKAGRILSELHVNYDSVEPYKADLKENELIKKNNPNLFYKVVKMKFDTKNSKPDKTSVIYNQYIKIEKIPLEAYEYIVNKKPALEWVMERQCIKIDSESGHSNDANDFAIEFYKDPSYPLKLFLKIINVSLETMAIIKNLPKLKTD